MTDHQSSTVLTKRLYIGGEWTESTSGDTFDATNPATGETIAEIPAGTREDVQRAVDAAREAAPEWAAKTAFERADVCREIADAIRAHSDELAALLTDDQGKPIDESRGEVETCAAEFEHAAAGVEHMRTDVVQSEDPDKRIRTIRQPHGVVGTITPWNFPVNIPAEYIAPGLATGNAMVWVPAPTTSAVAVRLAEIIAETDLPDGALNLVTGEGPVVGNELVVNDGTDAIGFTGSPETGEAIASDAGAKPTVLEMGGNGPVIVLDDADLDAAVECTAAGCFGNGGQICSASERILVHESIYEEFRDRMIAAAEAVTLGDPHDEETDMGPLNNEDVAAKMDRHVEDAVDRGAILHTGGGRAEGFPTDQYYQPTVLSGVTPEMVVNEEESFGPIAPLMEFSEYEEALEIANGIDLGLASSVFTQDLSLAREFAERIETGVVNVNSSSTNWEIHTPFGGYSGKRSGEGRVGGHAIIEELTQVKTISVDHGGPAFE
ncbi:MAG: aldehyde dehydrogenase [Haloarculaceae archaeon]